MSESVIEAKSLPASILDLSWRVGSAAPAMKPFFRPALVELGRVFQYWDFDAVVQRRLYALVAELSSPDEIVQLGIERWKENLSKLLDRRRQLLAAVRDKGQHNHPAVFDELAPFWAGVGQLVEAGKRLLYVGAGSGTECLQFAARAMRAVGIDTNGPLLAVGREWADYLNRPAHFVCMDLMEMGFRRESFDRFVLEFYGAWPARSRAIHVQRQLARVLKPDGFGVVSAARKCYASYWYHMSHPYPAPMMAWLAGYSRQDFAIMGQDGSEDRLLYGLFNRSYTVETLADELAHTFQVGTCRISPDQRYVQAVVRPRPGVDLDAPVCLDDARARPAASAARVGQIRAVLESVEQIADLLEAHTAEVVTCFQRDPSPAACLQTVQPDLDRFVALLDAATT